jgi:electron transfer flavoprotein beta subunit
LTLVVVLVSLWRIFLTIKTRGKNLKIIVLVKQTPDTEAKIEISEDSKILKKVTSKKIINPYDEYAIEEALLLKNKNPESEVVLACVGEEMAKDSLLKGLAMGADRAVCIRTADLSKLDSLLTAKILHQVCQEEQADVILCGKQGIDDDNMHVGIMVAELFGCPHINTVIKVEQTGEYLTVEREIEGGQVEKYKTSLPVVLGAHKSLNTPRYAALPGIMKAKRKPMAHKTLQDFGLDEQQIEQQTKTKVESYALPKQKPQGQIFKDEPTQVMVEKVVKLLREEAKVI